MELILTFGSTHRVLKAESVLKEAHRPFRLMPAPKALEKLCALVITIDSEAYAETQGVLTGAGLKPRAVYRRDGDECVEV